MGFSAALYHTKMVCNDDDDLMAATVVVVCILVRTVVPAKNSLYF